MELKHKSLQDLAAQAVSFNRTFMELKRAKDIRTIIKHSSFNRTFMELKPARK